MPFHFGLLCTFTFACIPVCQPHGETQHAADLEERKKEKKKITQKRRVAMQFTTCPHEQLCQQKGGCKHMLSEERRTDCSFG